MLANDSIIILSLWDLYFKKAIVLFNCSNQHPASQSIN